MIGSNQPTIVEALKFAVALRPAYLTFYQENIISGNSECKNINPHYYLVVDMEYILSFLSNMASMPQRVTIEGQIVFCGGLLFWWKFQNRGCKEMKLNRFINLRFDCLKNPNIHSLH